MEISSVEPEYTNTKGGGGGGGGNERVWLRDF